MWGVALRAGELGIPRYRPLRGYTMYFMLMGPMAERYYGDSRPRALCPPDSHPVERWAGYR